MDWTELGALPPKSLASTRLLLHWAAQIPSAAGATLLPARKDASETNLSWDEGSLVGARVGDKHAALRMHRAVHVHRGDARLQHRNGVHDDHAARELHQERSRLQLGQRLLPMMCEKAVEMMRADLARR